MAINRSAEELIIDDPERAIFKVNRQVFTDPEILSREQHKIFEKCWLYIGHESEIPDPGDFISRKLAGRPLIMVRGSDGIVRVLLNTCTHRGAMVCRERKGNANTFQCFYHAWTFDNQGRLVGVPGEDAYGPGFKRAELGLMSPAHTDNYRGFIFTTFNPNAESLSEFLAGAKEYLDLVCDQGEPDGLEVVSGSHDHCMYGNWKLLVENSFDPYHAGPTHQRYFNQFMQDMGREWGRNYGRGIARDLGNGHAVVETPTPPQIDQFQRQRWEEIFGPERTHRMIDFNHNLVIFPNLILINVWRTVRVLFPVTSDYVEVAAWAMMPTNEPKEIRRARLDAYLSFLGPAGFGTPDDCEALESCQRGFANKEIQWSDLSRGILNPHPVPTDELQLRTFWRRWNQLMFEQ